ncbi:MAG: MSMEG_6728 family protein [Pseudomonadota bacterium]|jgi:hypothetical protein
MQTFLPYPDFAESARCLDYRRLGKQRVEAYQLLQALFYGGGWANHPATRMWRGHALALATYGLACCDEWTRRNYRDHIGVKFREFLDANAQHPIHLPDWIGNVRFHRSHQSNLLRKHPEHYGKFGWDVSPHLPYIWPVPGQTP